MIRYSISIVDDEESIRDGLELILSEEYDISCFTDAESFLSDLETNLPDLVLMDIGLPAMNGIEALAIIKKKAIDIPVIMITAFEDINMVILSMKTGAFDFILKPMNPDILELTIKKAISSIALRKEVKILQEKYLKDNNPCFIGESKDIEDVMDFINMVAKSPDTPIMIMGETGTGKELIAKAIHARSPVFQGPFIAVNCSAFPDELIESELFGYEEGAFSGAKKQGKKGFIEEADKGTLFLDEVADLSLAGQAKLLRFLESGEFYKVGSTRKYKVNVRLVSATNKNLEELIDQERFRKDLFFRLCVVKAKIPSLNERRDDILPLAKYFLYGFNKKFKKNLKNISKEVQELLLSHKFSGNVRELKNIIERACLIAQNDVLIKEDLGLNQKPRDMEKIELDSFKDNTLHIPDQGMNIGKLLKNIEKKYMEHALKLTRGNESKAARLLEMNHHTFRYKWKKLILGKLSKK
ncbi:MAG: sigma-54-dependent Fis family transcriptional regulator [Desulfobacula sp.]|uniref:sigma-54-dependent transcriptional regulator n=1 Tax=Desulfobacula sp. TaxID=2593537 RepID=UPI001DEB0945|nr:sigma-54-dependent Fis family transcriptional regulator [Desulfobacula sp.]MBT3486726.1 sigma-54-dependent Fis family transcriptional regulator [Desulfobacula sp.]MBT3805096.1 sigma-54-dependent Fis family transcriptional regulator [Desulfobacula sp.]MBT4026014.1 sigma-54-dependent Fis family transcriptional regulator [Desulfobacula sp.]MBT4199771.1 sigma-54-dependent Fis family transcriptional regulator [Desulfobacula sp.]